MYTPDIGMIILAIPFTVILLERRPLRNPGFSDVKDLDCPLNVEDAQLGVWVI